MIIIDLANHAKTDFSYWKKGGSYKLNFAEGDFVVVTLDFQLSFRIKLHIFFDIFCCAWNFPGLIGLCQNSFVVKFNKAACNAAAHASSLA